jgi:muramoyltetrapeptide carboxypeptidase
MQMKRKDFLKNTVGSLVAGSLLSSFENAPTRSKILPKGLKAGDLIGITAPAGSIWNKAHIEKIKGILHEQGFKTKVGKTVYAQEGYLAGSDELRATELMDFFKDPTVKAILTMRGGWGCARILDRLDYNIIRENPKIIIGFSDITSLVNAIHSQTGMITFHGPCGYSSWGKFTLDQVKQTLVGGHAFTLKNPQEYEAPLITYQHGKATGELIGGNLTVIATMIGTKYEPNWFQKLLFLEEIGEEPYRIDRLLWQLKQAGAFEQINGLILGSFKNCSPEEPSKSFSLAEVFEQHFNAAKFPVYYGAAIGHIGPKFTVPIGAKAQMDADMYTIQILESSIIPQ